MSLLNRLASCRNEYQGKAKRVLCVFSAGILRSPTVAWVLSNEPFNFNTRSAGCVSSFALIPLDDVLVNWADEIVCMEPEHAENLPENHGKPVYVLHLPDHFPFRHPELVRLATERLLTIYGTTASHEPA